MTKTTTTYRNVQLGDTIDNEEVTQIDSDETGVKLGFGRPAQWGPLTDGDTPVSVWR
jgi:hypothetical protein